MLNKFIQEYFAWQHADLCNPLQNLPVVSHVCGYTQLSSHEACNLTLDSGISTTTATMVIPLWPPPRGIVLKWCWHWRKRGIMWNLSNINPYTCILKLHLFPLDCYSTCSSLIHLLAFLHIQLPFLSISWRHVTLNQINKFTDLTMCSGSILMFFSNIKVFSDGT